MNKVFQTLFAILYTIQPLKILSLTFKLILSHLKIKKKYPHLPQKNLQLTKTLHPRRDCINPSSHSIYMFIVGEVCTIYYKQL